MANKLCPGMLLQGVTTTIQLVLLKYQAEIDIDYQY